MVVTAIGGVELVGGGKFMSAREPRTLYNNYTTLPWNRHVERKKKKKLLCEYFAISLRHGFGPWIFPRQLLLIVITIIIMIIIHHYVSTADHGGVPFTEYRVRRFEKRQDMAPMTTSSLWYRTRVILPKTIPTNGLWTYGVP